jgi:E3 ubiquitin-protein ligase DOA10
MLILCNLGRWYTWVQLIFLDIELQMYKDRSGIRLDIHLTINPVPNEKNALYYILQVLHTASILHIMYTVRRIVYVTGRTRNQLNYFSCKLLYP